MLTAEDLHEAAEYVGADEDGARIGQAGIAKDDVIEFVMGSDFSYANGEPADVDPASLALGIAIGVTAANGVPEV